jgi:ABC-type transporter MlaC component
MKRSLLLVGATVVAIALTSSAQTTPINGNQEQLAALIKQVRDQQVELGANQAKIDEKLATVAESIRQARIYSSRAGR